MSLRTSAAFLAAQLAGAKTFDAGIPCRRGHSADRYVSTLTCVECGRDDYARNADRARGRERERRRVRSAEINAHRRELHSLGSDGRAAIAGDRRKGRLSAIRKHDRERKAVRYAAKADQIRARARERYRENPERVRAAVREWCRANPEKKSAMDARRRGRRKGLPTDATKARADFIRWSRNAPRVRCYWCRGPTAKRDRHIDHIIPIARGGSDTVGNLCVSCRPCNMSKHTKMPEEFSGQSELAFG